MRVTLLAAVLGLAGLAPAWAIYLPMDVVDVPVDRILANLEARLKKDPADGELHHALARVHSIAYARGDRTLPLRRPLFAKDKDEAPDERQLAGETAPPEVRANVGADPAARGHLEQAVAHYREAVRLSPDSLTAAMGYGWTLAESGDDSSAREQYRDVLDRATQREWYSMAQEAGSYLLPLLSVFSQARERAALEKRLEELDRKIRERPRAVTPVLVPLESGLPFEALVARDAAVAFDLDGSGLRHRWQWITPRAGWLVYRGTGARAVDSGIRFVGSRTFWMFWTDGYAAMAALDDDADGWLSGRELDGLAVWRDPDMDGVVDPGELMALADLGIAALSCAHARHPEGFEYSPAGVVLADGSVRASYDWIASSVPEGKAGRGRR
jgi:tetratricopeptide (TPR) repeat protein